MTLTQIYNLLVTIHLNQRQVMMPDLAAQGVKIMALSDDLAALTQKVADVGASQAAFITQAAANFAALQAALANSAASADPAVVAATAKLDELLQNENAALAADTPTPP